MGLMAQFALPDMRAMAGEKMAVLDGYQRTKFNGNLAADRHH